MASSISAASRTSTALAVTPNEGATTSMARKRLAQLAFCRFKMNATQFTLGATFFSSCSHFPPISGSKFANPVRFPPGRARLATKPTPTGSEIPVNTIGIVWVSFRRAAKIGVLFQKIASGAERAVPWWSHRVPDGFQQIVNRRGHEQNGLVKNHVTFRQLGQRFKWGAH